jgi:formylglycine-generating enzyme required for sulfatase activity
VGAFPANQFGLRDMHGNVWEWVEDCAHENYVDAPTDGSAWLEEGRADCTRRVVRGGSWAFGAGFLVSGTRVGIDSDNADDYVGFRLARTL